MKKRTAASPRASAEALVQLFSQLAIAARSGLPFADTMRIIAQDAGVDRASGEMLRAVGAHVAAGGSLSDALQRAGTSFAPETIALVRNAETSERLAPVLEMLARDYEHRARFRTAARGAVFWPATAFGFCVLIFVVLATFVVPVYRDLFANFEAQLPGPTRVVIAVSEVFVRGWFVWLALLVLAAVAWRKRARLPGLRAQVDRVSGLVPALRTYLARTLASRLSGVLLAASEGAPLRESLAHLRATMASSLLAQQVATLEKQVASGKALGDAVAAVPELPARLRVAVELGVKSDRLGTALQQARALSDDDTERSLVRLEQFALIAVYLFVGFVVGFLVIAMYLPIFKMGSVL